MNSLFLITIVIIVNLYVISSCKCFISYDEQFGITINEKIISKQPHTYMTTNDLPINFDWRNINGTNYCSRVLTQQSPNVCGSCWAESVTGALTDRYLIATNNKLQIQLSPQQLLNFNARTSGGSCNGGDDLKAYEFISVYGISDDTCAPFVGLNWLRGFEVASMTDVDEVRDHMCYICTWGGTCGFVPHQSYNLYGVDEYGTVLGEFEMMAEIYARGPISCSINSEPTQFNAYRGGIIKCDIEKESNCHLKTDHVVVITGWGVDKLTNQSYWVGRNSYGTQWGEGAGGGWFRLERGTNALSIESTKCRWGVPASKDVERALQQFDNSNYI